MKIGGIGGADTRTGLVFEERVDLISRIEGLRGYSRSGNQIYYKGELIAYYFKKRSLYTYLDSMGISYRDYISKRLEPDNALFLPKANRFIIVEMKFQQTNGSVDEKLQTGDFKKRQYEKLFSPLGTDVDFIYLLSDYFDKPRYQDVFDYMEVTGCRHYFNILPFSALGLPDPEAN